MGVGGKDGAHSNTCKTGRIANCTWRWGQLGHSLPHATREKGPAAGEAVAGSVGGHAGCQNTFQINWKATKDKELKTRAGWCFPHFGGGSPPANSAGLGPISESLNGWHVPSVGNLLLKLISEPGESWAMSLWGCIYQLPVWIWSH